MGTKNLAKALELMGRIKFGSFDTARERQDVYTIWKDAQMELAALKDALAPFAEFARRFNLKPIGNTERADVLYGIHAGEKELEADVRLSHCRAALKALGEES